MNIVVNEVISKVVVINKGLKGDDGVGVPDGGTLGQVLAKNSNADQDIEWVNPAGGGDLISANNLSDVANTDTARQNLGAITNAESIVNSLIFG